MKDFILGVLASLVASYIVYLCSKIKDHSSTANRKSGLELDVKIKFKKYK